MRFNRIQKTIFISLVALMFLPLATLAKDEWIHVRSKNFNLVGNAREKEMRAVATKLEQFRETFRQLFSGTNLNSPIPTNVVVFKSDGSYKPFKPKRADGKIDNNVAGYFQPGPDVNYITLSTEGENADTYGTIFHEYVHFIIETNFGKSEIPPWFNEGLAEYYQTFEIENDSKVKLGLLQNGHLQLLQQTKLMPLEQLFKVDNYSLHQTGSHSRSIFYAQSWALIHLLLQSKRSDELIKFLDFSIKNVPSEKAFQDAFQMNYKEMEKELQKYVSKSSYLYSTFTFPNKLVFDDEIQVSPLSEALSNAYLGDLLYHTNRVDDAEEFLKKALTLDPNLSMANTTFGMVKIKQRKYAEAKGFLEKAIAEDLKNHLAFYNFAFLLSMEDRDEFGFVSSFPDEKAEKMRNMLKKAIALNPEFTESYELFGFVSLVNNDQFEEAEAMLRRALHYQPGNQRYALRIAEIKLRQEKLSEADDIARKIAETTDDPEVKSRAESIVMNVKSMQDFQAKQAAAKKKFEEASANVEKNRSLGIVNLNGDDLSKLSPEELAKIREEESLIGINGALKKPEDNEKQVIGRLEKIECKGKIVTYTVKTATETILLNSDGFQNIALVSFLPAANSVAVGCRAEVSKFNAVLTYKTDTTAKWAIQGELSGIDFVPDSFRFMDVSAIQDRIIITKTPQSGNTEEDKAKFEELQREGMMRSLKAAMRPLGEGEKQALGKLEKIECTNKGSFFHLKTGTTTFRFKVTQGALEIKGFTPEIGQMQFDCGLKSLDVPVVFTYVEDPKMKDKVNGELVSLEFVPGSFKLDH